VFPHPDQLFREGELRHRSLLAEVAAARRVAGVRPARPPRPSRAWLAAFAALAALVARLS
jgi:hypothetical protein